MGVEEFKCPDKVEPQEETEGTDAPVVCEVLETLPGGGKAHKLSRDYTLFPDDALRCMVEVMTKQVPSHGRENWRKLPLSENDKHDIDHYYEAKHAEADPQHTVENILMHRIHHAIRAVMGLAICLQNTKCDKCN